MDMTLLVQHCPKKEIACTRSFGQPVSELPALEQAVSTFASMAAQKLRKQASHTALSDVRDSIEELLHYRRHLSALMVQEHG